MSKETIFTEIFEKKKIKLAVKKAIDDRDRIHNINLECARQGAKKEVFDDIKPFIQRLIRWDNSQDEQREWEQEWEQEKQRLLTSQSTDSENKE